MPGTYLKHKQEPRIAEFYESALYSSLAESDEFESFDKIEPIEELGSGEEGQILDSEGNLLAVFVKNEFELGEPFEEIAYYDVSENLDEETLKDLFLAFYEMVDADNAFVEIESDEVGDGSWMTKVIAKDAFDYVVKYRNGYVSYPRYFKLKNK